MSNLIKYFELDIVEGCENGLNVCKFTKDIVVN
jgi:hypothetical protein